jgi:hypothetical protein
MSTQAERNPEVVPFHGVRGRALAALLQLKFVRFHRVQLGFVQRPTDYARFISDVIAPRVQALPGRLGIFGVGEHTRFLLNAAPELGERTQCFIDNNAALWRQERFGKVVLPPAEAVAQCDVILLSTAVFQHVLKADLGRLRFRGAVVAMDDTVAPHWFLAA